MTISKFLRGRPVSDWFAAKISAMLVRWLKKEGVWTVDGRVPHLGANEARP